MFNKIDVSMFKDYMTKYPNGKTIFESLSETISSFNKAVDDVNTKISEGILKVDQAENSLRITLEDLFDDLEMEYNSDFNNLSQVLTAAVLNKADQSDLDAISAQLADIASKSLKVKNDITNGDFANNLTNWIPANITFSKETDSLKILASTQFAYIQQARTITNGRKYYFGAEVKTTSNLVEISISGLGLVKPVGNGTFEKLSTQLTWIAATGIWYPRIRDGRASGWDNIYVRNFMLVDLTTIFGAGNEPTKSEMDTLINLIGWFDGEITLSEKQLAIWTLNLIRQNRNAIVALGGTII